MPEELHNGKQLEHRLTTLEKDVEYIKKQVDNHIPTSISEVKSMLEKTQKNMQETVDSISSRLWAFIVAFALSLLGLLLTIIFK